MNRPETLHNVFSDKWKEEYINPANICTHSPVKYPGFPDFGRTLFWVPSLTHSMLKVCSRLASPVKASLLVLVNTTSAVTEVIEPRPLCATVYATCGIRTRRGGLEEISYFPPVKKPTQL
jgi:hypothetical protein